MAFALLAACSTGSPISTAANRRAIDATSAFVIPPAGSFSIVGVTERNYANATQQEISLSTDSSLSGQNWIRATLFGPVAKEFAGQTALSNRALALGSIDSEVRRAIPGVRLARSPYYVQNRYGPFGYATGRRGRDTCLFGWQRLNSRPSLIGNKGSIEVRLRICDRNATEQELLSAMYGYTIAAYFSDRGWNPYDRAPSPDPSLGTSEAEIRPGDKALERTVESGSSGRTAAPRRAGRASTSPPAAPVSQPTPRGPPIPPPPTSTEQPPLIPDPAEGSSTR